MRKILATAFTIISVTACASQASDPSGEQATDHVEQAACANADEQNTCVLILAKIQPGEEESRIIDYRCGDTDAVLEEHGIAAQTAIMTWYEHSYYNEGACDGQKTVVYGDSGPCDNLGYGIGDTGSRGLFWRHNISSFKGWSWCNYVKGWDQAGYKGTLGEWHNAGNPSIGVPHVGALNDRLRSFWVARR